MGGAPLGNYHFYGVEHKFFNLVSCFTSAPINHKGFWQNISCIRKPQVISGGGGAHPLHPLPRFAPVLRYVLELAYDRPMYGNPWKSWLLDSTQWIPDSQYRSLLVELGFRILIVSGILDCLSCFPDSKDQDFDFHKHKFPGFS